MIFNLWAFPLSKAAGGGLVSLQCQVYLHNVYFTYLWFI